MQAKFNEPIEMVWFCAVCVALSRVLVLFNSFDSDQRQVWGSNQGLGVDVDFEKPKRGSPMPPGLNAS